MNTSTDYTKLAASLDYAALEMKLAQLSERQPPKRRKHIADVLEPLRERLLTLSHNGWSSHEIAGELTAAGIPVSPARLRECLGRWAGGRRPDRDTSPSSSAACRSAYGHAGRVSANAVSGHEVRKPCATNAVHVAINAPRFRRGHAASTRLTSRPLRRGTSSPARVVATKR